MDEINRLAALEGAEINEAKKVLATEATALLHGRAAAAEAEETARQTFEEGGTAATLPTIEVSAAELHDGIGVLAAFVMADLAASNGEARRHMKGGALKVNHKPATDDKASINDSDLVDGAIKLSVGKKRHVLIKPV